MHVYGRFPGQEMKIDSEHGPPLLLQQKEIRRAREAERGQRRPLMLFGRHQSLRRELARRLRPARPIGNSWQSLVFDNNRFPLALCMLLSFVRSFVRSFGILCSNVDSFPLMLLRVFTVLPFLAGLGFRALMAFCPGFGWALVGLSSLDN